MKCLFALLLATLMILSLTGCGQNPHEDIDFDDMVFIDHDEVYDSITPLLLTALKNGDAKAILEMFHSDAIEQIPDIESKIAEVISAYGGTFDEYGDFSYQFPEEYAAYIEYIEVCSSCTIPIRSGEEYYWISISAYYLDEENKKDPRITNLMIQCGKEARSKKTFMDFADYSIEILTGEASEEQLKVIGGSVYKVSEQEPLSDVQIVKDYLENSLDFNEFANRYGWGILPREELIETNIGSFILDNKTFAYEIATDDGSELYVFFHTGNMREITIVELYDDLSHTEDLYRESRTVVVD